MNDLRQIIREINRLALEAESILAHEEHALTSLRAELDGVKTELHYLRNENITLRSNQ